MCWNLKFQNRTVDVVQDVCQRWGYAVHMLDTSVANDLDRHEDGFTMLYFSTMPYRIFQNQTMDKVCFHNVPVGLCTPSVVDKIFP